MSWKVAVSVMAVVVAGGCSNRTAGNLFEASFSIGGLQRPDAGPLFFTTELGWAVELDAAKIDLGPFYFNIDPPNTGEFRDGVVIAESLRQVTVDTLNPALVPVTDGVSGQTGAGAGPAVAVEIELFPPDSTITDPDVGGPAKNATAYLAGVASMGVTQVPFEGWVIIDSSLASVDTPLPWIQRVNGAECDLNFVTSPSLLTLQVDPTTWFNGADFAQLLPAQSTDAGTADGGPGGPYGWTVDSAFQAAVLNNIQATTGVYAFELTPQ